MTLTTIAHFRTPRGIVYRASVTPSMLHRDPRVHGEVTEGGVVSAWKYLWRYDGRASVLDVALRAVQLLELNRERIAPDAALVLEPALYGLADPTFGGRIANVRGQTQRITFDTARGPITVAVAVDEVALADDAQGNREVRARLATTYGSCGVHLRLPRPTPESVARYVLRSCRSDSDCGDGREWFRQVVAALGLEYHLVCGMAFAPATVAEAGAA